MLFHFEMLASFQFPFTIIMISRTLLLVSSVFSLICVLVYHLACFAAQINFRIIALFCLSNSRPTSASFFNGSASVAILCMCRFIKYIHCI